jgi:hypothetical protein
MNSTTRRRPSPALFVSVIALVAALVGTASALPGSNTVSKNDLKKSAVGGSEIAKNAVKSADVKDGKLKGRDLAEGSVGAAELADSEPFHRVGAPGEPVLSNGGEGDCVWGPPPVATAGFNPLSFYKDPLDVVQLAGAVQATDGPGGDGACDPVDPGEAEDAIAFTLPEGYRPENLSVAGTSDGPGLVVPDEGATISGQAIPGGSVLAVIGGSVLLDGGVFRAAGEGTAVIEASAPARVGSLEALGRTLD